MNSIALTGRLTNSPELKKTPQGISVISFTLAVKKQKADEVDFIDCVAWRGIAEFISAYCKKGTKIEVCGKLQTRTYEYNGTKRKATEVLVETVDFGESKKAEAADLPNYEKAEPSYTEVGADEDLPF